MFGYIDLTYSVVIGWVAVGCLLLGICRYWVVRWVKIISLCVLALAVEVSSVYVI